MITKYGRSNPYMGILVLISVTKVYSERCPLGSLDQLQVFPPPPEFPDFMAAFEGTILRIGLRNLLGNDRLALSKSCPGSVNWSEFNSRLCGNDPFDLEGFCNPTTTTTEPTVASITTPQIAEVTTISIETTTEQHLIGVPTIDLSINTSPSTPIRTSRSPGLTHSNETEPISPGTTHNGLKDPGPKNPVLTPDVYEVKGSTGVAEALYQGDGASIAIGIGCGLTLLFVVIIVVIIVISQTRGRGCRRLMNPLFKVFQRQTSDARPFKWSSPSQPSTPLEEMSGNGGILMNIDEAQLRWTEERRSTGFVTTEAQDNLLTDFHQNKLEEESDGGTSAVSSTSKTLKDKGQGQTMVSGDESIADDTRNMVESRGGLVEAGPRNGKRLENGDPLRDTVQIVAWESWASQLFDKLK